MKDLHIHFIKKTRLAIYLLAFLWLLLLSGSQDHPAFAYSVNLSIDAIEDAGLAPLQNAFARFVKASDKTTLHEVVSAPPNRWNSANDVILYANSKGITNWLLESAGDIWSKTDLIVGESLTGLTAGPYRITVLGGAFMRDAFGWSDYKGLHWWELHIQARDSTGSPYGQDLLLGSTDHKTTAADALSPYLGTYRDIYVPAGGSLVFWIYDVNSIDNSGALEINVALVPLPGTLLLFGTGLLFLSARKTLKR